MYVNELKWKPFPNRVQYHTGFMPLRLLPISSTPISSNPTSSAVSLIDLLMFCQSGLPSHFICLWSEHDKLVYFFGHGVVFYFIMQSLLAINSEKLTVLLRFDPTRHLCFHVFLVSSLIIFLRSPNYHGIVTGVCKQNITPPFCCKLCLWVSLLSFS